MHNNKNSGHQKNYWENVLNSTRNYATVVEQV